MKLGNYIKGERSGREAHDLERRAMDDPLLADALDGFDAMAGDHTGAIERLRGRVAADVRQRKNARRSRSSFYMRSVAASLLLCLCLGGYLAWVLRAPQPTYGTLPAYPDLEPWEGSRELIAENRAYHGTSCPETRLPVGIASDMLMQDDILPARSSGPAEREQALIAMSADLDRKAGSASETMELALAKEVLKESKQGAPEAAPRAESTKLTVVHRAQIDKAFMDDQDTADEVVVVVGYGEMKKSDLTGAVALVKEESKFEPSAEQLARMQPQTFEYSLSGRVAGVQVQKQNDSAAAIPIRIRGTSSLSRAASAVADNEEPFIIVEQMPTFKGGDIHEFYHWIVKRITYKGSVEDLGVPDGSRVNVSFVIEKDGSVTHVSLLKGSNQTLNDEVIRIINSSPRWKPGKQKGTTVRVKMTLPMEFHFQVD
ncbi:MAG: energy transducer TonB [Rikenellaceae bacterium]|jgi:hypothetical protein|nr:energy transducer TonB [Rikenellaceae bacterium]